MAKLSIIIPVLNEAENIPNVLAGLCDLQNVEVIVVDGGSTDNTIQLAQTTCAKVLVSPNKGRAAQMNFGAEEASGEILLFLHADTILPDNFIQQIATGLAVQWKCWGRFNVAFDGPQTIFRIIAFFMNTRSRWTGIATGDQAMFVKTTIFKELGGFANIPLMEDVELSRRLKRLSSPVCLSAKVITSSRRWEKKGIVKTILLMWRLRLAYFLGVHPDKLVKQYY